MAETILGAAVGYGETGGNLRADPPRFDDKLSSKRLDLTVPDAENVTWTRNLIRRGLSVSAGYAQEPAERFGETIRTGVEERAAEAGRAVRRLAGEEAAVVRLQTSTLPPGGGRDERIARYERHLHSLLTPTRRELERLRARRDGEAVPPAVADLNVRIESG